MKKLMTLCFIHDDDKILLGMKKRGFGEGHWNGFGGKPQVGESLEAAAKREVVEEIGVEVMQLDKRGVLNFQNQGDKDLIEVHVFRVIDYAGEPVESEEMRPQWFKIDEIPFDTMWVDDQYWIPLYLANKLFQGSFLFRDFKEVLKYSVEEVEKLER